MELYGTDGALFVPDPNWFGGTRRARRARRQDRRGHPVGPPLRRPERHPPAAAASPTTAPPASPTWRWRSSRAATARCSLDRALHGVDVMTSILKSGETGAFVELTTTCTRPEPARTPSRRARCSPEGVRRHDLRPRRRPATTTHGLPPLRRERPAAARRLARPLAQLRRRHARTRPSARSCRTAFDLGITHFDLANNYGPPPGSAEDSLRRDPRAPTSRGLPRRADHLDQGRLPHVARPLRRVGQPQVPDRLAATRA